MKKRRPLFGFRYWLGHLALPVVVILLLVCTDVEFSSRTGGDSTDGAAVPVLGEIVVPGDTLAVFPPNEDGPIYFAGILGLALAEDGASIFVLDANQTVHQLTFDGEHLGQWGREGSGPGEMRQAMTIQPAAGGGAWAYDPSLRRAARFGQGEIVNVSNIDGHSIMFAPFGEGVLLPAVGSGGNPMNVSKTDLLTYFGPTGKRDLVPPDSVPDVFALDGFDNRIAGWFLVNLSPTEIGAVLSGSELSAWRMVLDASGERIETLEELPVPEDIRQRVRAIETPEGSLSAHVRTARVVDGTLWVVKHFGYAESETDSSPMAFGIPLTGDADPLRVNRFPLDPELMVSDVIVLSDRIVLATQTEVTFVERVQAEVHQP